MLDKTCLLLAAAGLAAAGPVAAQIAPVPTPAPTPAPASAPFAAPVTDQTFPSGVEVLSVDGQPLGVLDRVETREGGERILHIRRPDGSVTTAPAVVASRGERAVVLEWTRAEFDAPATAVATSEDAAASPVPPTL